MEAPKILHAEIPRPHQCHGEGVAERKSHRGAGGGREIIGTGFALNRCIQDNVHLRRERGAGIAQNADAPRRQVTQKGNDLQQLQSVAAFRNHQGGIAGRIQAQIAMRGFGSVQKNGGRSGAAKGGNDLASDQAGLAEASNHQLAWRGENHFHRAG